MTTIQITAQDLASKLDITCDDLGLAPETLVTAWPDGRAQADLDGVTVDLTVSMRTAAASALRSSFRWFRALVSLRNARGGHDGYRSAEAFEDGDSVAAFANEDDALDAACEGAEAIGYDPDDMSVEETD